jgi:ribose 5-phosphate isomerase B
MTAERERAWERARQRVREQSRQAQLRQQARAQERAREQPWKRGRGLGQGGEPAGRLRLGIAADHGGFELKRLLLAQLARLTELELPVTDYGAHELDPADDYPLYVAPLARGVAAGELDRGIAICGSGVGACVAANKVAGVRAALITDHYSAHQGVEHDDLNVLCLGGRVTGPALAWDLVCAFLAASFQPEERFRRRLRQVQDLETNGATVLPRRMAAGPPLDRGREP